MSLVYRVGLLWLLLVGPVLAASIPAIAYHDIVLQRGADEYAITLQEFRDQLAYLQHEGYTPISLRQLAAAQHGDTPLPRKPVLLSFDDGLKSFAQYALPVLREYHYPSVLAVVSAWIDGRATAEQYQDQFLTWTQLREIAAAGDVEIISHSDNLHHGMRSNPQGNLAPAGITREYRGKARYESEAAYQQRVRADLTQSRQRLLHELNHAPVAIAWPYGQYDATLVLVAAQLGMHLHLTLADEPSGVEDLPRINRTTFHHYRRLADFDDMLTWRKWRKQQQRFIEISLDSFADRTAAQQAQQLSVLLDRLELLQVNSVIVQPLSQDQQRAYFANPAIPVAGDILSHVLQQIRTRVHVDHLYLRLPLLSTPAKRTAIFTELARLNRFDGILLETGEITPALQILLDKLREFNPAMQVGLRDSASSDTSLHWSEIDANTSAKLIEQRARALLESHPQTLIVLQRTPTLSDAQLATAMQALRCAGVRHYGYSNDDAQANHPALTRISAELHAHVITADREAR